MKYVLRALWAAICEAFVEGNVIDKSFLIVLAMILIIFGITFPKSMVVLTIMLLAILYHTHAVETQIIFHRCSIAAHYVTGSEIVLRDDAIIIRYTPNSSQYFVLSSGIKAVADRLIYSNTPNVIDERTGNGN